MDRQIIRKSEEEQHGLSVYGFIATSSSLVCTYHVAFDLIVETTGEGNEQVIVWIIIYGVMGGQLQCRIYSDRDQMDSNGNLSVQWRRLVISI